MKPKTMLKKVLLFCGIMMAVINLSGCYQQRMIKYYSDERNFMTVTAEISFLNQDEGSNSLYIAFSDLPEVFSDNCFKISGKNWEILEAKGGVDCFSLGDVVEFVTAPRYFGDGYVMPIVALSADGNSLLDYEEGYRNYMDSYN